jgi:hypothetical protein
VKADLLIRVALLGLILGCPLLCAGDTELGCCDDKTPSERDDAPGAACFCTSNPLPVSAPTTVPFSLAPLAWLACDDEVLSQTPTSGMLPTALVWFHGPFTGPAPAPLLI